MKDLRKLYMYRLRNT